MDITIRESCVLNVKIVRYVPLNNSYKYVHNVIGII